MAIFRGIWQKQEERRLMKAKIQSPKKMKVSKPTKYKKIEVPVVKAAKKELTKAEKRLTTAKKKLSELVKESKKK